MTPNDGTPATAEEVLLKAADEIAEWGHVKGTYAALGGAVCAYGAMSRVVTGRADYTFAAADPDAMGLIDQAAELLAANLDLDPRAPAVANFQIVTRFNDDPKTSGEDVILMMKRAANHG